MTNTITTIPTTPTTPTITTATNNDCLYSRRYKSMLIPSTKVETTTTELLTNRTCTIHSYDASTMNLIDEAKFRCMHVLYIYIYAFMSCYQL